MGIFAPIIGSKSDCLHMINQANPSALGSGSEKDREWPCGS